MNTIIEGYRTDLALLKQTEEEIRFFENNKEEYLKSLKKFQSLIEKESEDISELYVPFSENFRWELFKKDCSLMSTYRSNRTSDGKVWPTDTVLMYNTLFGPVGITWDSNTKISKPMEVKTLIFDSKETSKQDCFKYLKENRPLLYCIGFSKKAYRQVDFWTPISNDEPAWNQYMIRYFEDVGNLPWWKYQLQTMFCKFNPKWNWLRGLVYRILVTK